MKKKILALSMIIICIGIITSSTIAYFTFKGLAQNTITTGKVDVEIFEYIEEDDELISTPKGSNEIMPGMDFSKIIKVKNHDSLSYVRAKLIVVLKDSDDYVIQEENINNYFDINLDINNTDWITQEDDEWFYYNKPLDKEELSEPLFTTIKFNGDLMNNEYKNLIMEVKVEVEGVQAANNGANVLEANGWPSEN